MVKQKNGLEISKFCLAADWKYIYILYEFEKNLDFWFWGCTKKQKLKASSWTEWFEFSLRFATMGKKIEFSLPHIPPISRRPNIEQRDNKENYK